MMAPPKRHHSFLCFELAWFLRDRITPGLRGFTEAGIRLPDSDHAFYVTDLAFARAADNPADPEADSVKNPLCILEILSPTTERHDRLRKARDYQRIPSVREIGLLSVEHRSLELFRRHQDGTWPDHASVGSEVFELTSIGVSESLEAVFGLVER